MREKIRKTLLVIFSIIFIISASLVGYNLYNYYHTVSKDDDLAEEVEMVADTSWRDAWKGLKEKNEDFYAWLSWDSGIIDTPVMMPAEDNADYYLTHDFDKNYTELGGAAFVSPGNTRLDNQNLVIYGHAVFYYGSKTMPLMFSPLLELTDQTEFDANKTFWLHFENTDEQYELVYVCDVNPYEDEWDYEKKDFGSEEEFNEWISAAEEKNVVSSESTIQYTDSLVTFQTCQQLGGKQRLVLVAKRIA